MKSKTFFLLIVLLLISATACSPAVIQVPDISSPIITNISILDITETSVVITWTTDEPTDSQIEYGTSDIYGASSALLTSLVSIHTTTIEGLTPDMSYHFRVKCSDASGNQSISEDDTFTTLEPDITPLAILEESGDYCDLESTIIQSQSDLDDFISDIQQQDDLYDKDEILQNVTGWQIDFSTHNLILYSYAETSVPTSISFGEWQIEGRTAAIDVTHIKHGVQFDVIYFHCRAYKASKYITGVIFYGNQDVYLST